MPPIHFQTIVGSEQVIRPPSGVNLPEGLIEVIVTMPEEVREAGNHPTAVRDWLLGLATESERVAPKLPVDLAEHHDHYAHGKPLS